MKHSPQMKAFPIIKLPSSLRPKLLDESKLLLPKTDLHVKLSLLKSFRESLENELILIMQINESNSSDPKNRRIKLAENHKSVKERFLEIKDELNTLLNNLKETEKLKIQLLENKKIITNENSKLIPEFVRRKSGNVQKTPFISRFKTMIRKSFNDIGLVENK